MFIFSLSFAHPTLEPGDLGAFLESELNAQDVEVGRDGDPPRLEARFRHLWMDSETVAAQVRRRFVAGGVMVDRSGEAGVATEEEPSAADLEAKAAALQERVLELLDSAGSMRIEGLRRVLTRRSYREISGAVRSLVQAGAVKNLGDGWFTPVRDGPPRALPVPAAPRAAKPPPRPGDQLPPESLAARLRDLSRRVPVLSRQRIAAWAEGVPEAEIGRVLARLSLLKVLRRVGRDLYVAADRPDPDADEMAVLGLKEPPRPQPASPKPDRDPGQEAVARALAGGEILAAERLLPFFPSPAAQVRRALTQLVRDGRVRKVGRDLYVAASRPEPTRAELRAARPRKVRPPAQGSVRDVALQALEGGAVLRFSDLAKATDKTRAALSGALKSLVEGGAVRRLGPGLYIRADQPDPAPEALAKLLETAAPRKRSRTSTARRGLPGAILARLAESPDLILDPEAVRGFEPGATAAAARMALRVLAQEGALRRVRPGLYVAPGQPDPETPSQAATPSRRERTQPRSVDLAATSRPILLALADGDLRTQDIEAALTETKISRPGLLRDLGRLTEAGLVARLGATKGRRWAITPAGRALLEPPAAQGSEPARGLRPGRLPQAILDHLAGSAEITPSEAVALVPGTTPGYASVALSSLLKAGRIRRVAKGRYAAAGPASLPPDLPATPEPEIAPTPGGPEAPAKAPPARAASTGEKPGSISHRILSQVRHNGCLRLEQIFQLLPDVHPPSVKTALSSLTKAGLVLRAGKGLYEDPARRRPEPAPAPMAEPEATPEPTAESKPGSGNLPEPLLHDLLRIIDIEAQWTSEEIQARLTVPLGPDWTIGRALGILHRNRLIRQQVKADRGVSSRVLWVLTPNGLDLYGQLADPSDRPDASSGQGRPEAPPPATDPETSKPARAEARTTITHAILQVLAGGESLPVAEIRARIPTLQGKRSMASALLTRLEARGLVRRTRTSMLRDSRFSLSEKGRDSLSLKPGAADPSPGED